MSYPENVSPYQSDIKKLISNHNQRLQKLKEKQALEGLDTSPQVLIEIEDIERKIGELEAELKSLDKQLIPDFTMGTRHIRGSIEFAADNNLGLGIKIGGKYYDWPLTVVSSAWGPSFKSKEEVKSGWLFSDPPGWTPNALVFFKIHISNDGNGYIHIASFANPEHVVWIETGVGFKRQEKFCWDNPKIQRTAIWDFNWK